MTTDAGRTRARDYGSGRPPAINIAAAATASNPPAGGTGQNAGGWSGSSDRNDGIGSLIAAIADMNTLRIQLIALGIVDGSASDEGRVRARDIGSGKTPVRAVSVTVTASNPPAGGTGIQAGCYSSASNRNLFITSLTALIADVASMRTELSAQGVISGGLTADGKARIRDLGTGRIPRIAVSITATAIVPPAGGSGATAGGYDTANNRNLMITSLTAVIADIASLRVELVAMNIVEA